MHRTNLYLTDEQERALDARARAEGVSRSALVRSIIDRELAMTPAIDVEMEKLFGELADVYHESTNGMFDADADLRIEK
ncbi:MAG: ribbon-helix-helix protein, CopG family [Acidimicrobiales bacterium]|nr:ribbon-helix-helix protein, CopG family [Acidimicrobiales bacterium]